jgi:amino acid transporter
MAAQAGWWTLPAICILAVPFIVSSFVFRLMNRHFPNSGASYHWSAKVVGKRVSRYQAWILILAYFMSIPPIAIPAGSYTLALIAPHMRATPLDQTLATLFWVLFAAAPLLLGAKPTATITKIFFVIEMLSLGLLVIAGVVDYSSISVPIHFGTIPLGGMLVVAVVAATILDGWEIDSYAAEESKRPRVDPGKAGIVGAILAFCFYLTLYPLMFSETPISKLANSSDPLAVWGMRLFPHSPAVVLIPVIASTAGGLWLTTFILTRVIFAMGRENIVPSVFSRLSTRKVPHVATVTILIATMLVCSIQLFFHSISSFFGLVLSTAGFFLLAEFFLDSVVAQSF